MFRKGILRDLYDQLFGKTWAMWVGGILLAVLNILLFVIKFPWGASGGYVNMGQNLYQATGIAALGTAIPVSLHNVALLNIFIVIGAFAAALFSREFGIRTAPVGELVKGFLGGIFMGAGATIGVGCTTGGFFTGVAALSGGALILSLGFLLGTLVALKYLLWEMEKFPKFSMGKTCILLAGNKSKTGWQRWLGWLVILATLWIVSNYTSQGSMEMKVLGWHIFLALLLGIILQRSRYCIVRAFREPFMTGEATAPVAVISSVVVLLLGFTVLKYFGVGNAAELSVRAIELKSVYANFWINALIGGFIFGIGMTIAGGCAVGTLWRAGEGHVKLWLSAAGFTLMAPLSKHYLVPLLEKIIPAGWRKELYLPDYLGYAGAVILVLVILFLWYIFVKWNEKTGKFSAL